ncbi:MAG: gluconate 2-dehydrogenase subunit 3 family protein [Gammaproteobacteria bacterium]
MTEDEKFRQRRLFLKAALSAVPLGALFAAGLTASAESPAPEYSPTYFTSPEWMFINAAVDRLIPSNEDGPGALDLHVPEFIDRQMETDYGHGGRWYLQGPFHPEADATLGYQLKYSPRDLYRAAIADVNAWCQRAHGKEFADLQPQMRDDVLVQLEKGEIDLPNVKASEFFNQLLANTMEGYFADPMYGGNRQMGSWKMIGFPGARADFKDWVTQPGKPYPLGPVSIRGEKG